MSLNTDLTPTATDPPPANSPIMHSRLVHKDKKPKINAKPKKSWKWRETKLCDARPILPKGPLTRSLQSTGRWVFRNGTTHDRPTSRLRDSIGPVSQFVENG